MANVATTPVLCPHCGDNFSYPIPQEIPNQGDEIIKDTTCPICENPIKVRFEISREVEVLRDNTTREKRVIKPTSMVKAQKG